MSIFKKNFANRLDIIRDGLKPIPAGEYRLGLSKFKSLESGSVVLKFIIASKGDGSPSELEGRSVDHWLSNNSDQAAAMAGIIMRQLGLDENSFDDDATGLLPEILLVRANVELKPPYNNKPPEPQIKKILEIVDRTPQASGFDDVEVFG